MGRAAAALLIALAPRDRSTLRQPLKHDGVVRPPLERILSGAVWGSGDRSVELILANSDPADPGILWASGEPDEAFADFWITLTLGGELQQGTTGTVDGDPTLRGFAFAVYQQLRDTGAWATPPIAQLCDVVAAIGGPVRVVTADAGLEASIHAACPEVDAEVELKHE